MLVADDAIPTLARWLRESRLTAVFTGAGMSTESGLPDFRSAGGLWKQSRRFEELASTSALQHDFPEFVEFYRWRIQMLQGVEPHAGHRRIAGWQREGRVQALITQNVDGLHARAGSTEVLELHGSLRVIRCQRCGTEADSERFLTDEGIHCARCGGKMRPGVVLFGEALPEDTLRKAQEASERAELFLVLGSSLQVSPANYFPQVAKARGAKLVILNREPTALDALADLRLDGTIGETLERLGSLT
ncbi:NAD-dependent protein deacetylase [compost metagenome]